MYPFDDFGRILGPCFCLPLPLIVLVIVAVLAFRQFTRLQMQMAALEAEQKHQHRQLARVVRRLRGRQKRKPPRPAETVAVSSAAEEIPVVRPVRPPPLRPRTSPAPALPPINWEVFIGGRALGWVAVLLLLFATAFFLKYAIDNNWIDELGREVLGATAGAGLCVGGYLMHRRGWWLFAQMLTSAGIVLLYLITFAAFGFYHLLPRQPAAVFLILIIAEAALLALLYEAPAIAIMAVIGGLLTPMLLASDRDQYVSLFCYLAALNTGVVLLALVRRWYVFATLALVGTQALFSGWFAMNYHPDKRAACLLFQGGLFALYLAHPLILHLRHRQKATFEELGRWLLNAVFVAAAGYVLLEPIWRAWLGTLALGLACLYTLVVWLLQRRRSPDNPLMFTALATAMGFVAMVLPLETRGGWVAMGWAVQGLFLVFFGLRLGTLSLRVLGSTFLMMATLRLLSGDLIEPRAPQNFIPLVNRYGAAVLTVAACLLVAAWLPRRFRDRVNELDHVGKWLAGTAGLLLLLWILSLDAYRFFETRAEVQLAAIGARVVPDDPNLPPEFRNARIREQQAVFEQEDRIRQHGRRSGLTALSVIWALYAAALLAVGFWMRNAAMRWAALALFALTLGKVVLIDMGDLPGLYRVTAFFALAVVLGLAAWTYQRFANLKVAASEGSQP